MTARAFANTVLGGVVALGVVATAYCALRGGGHSLARCAAPALLAILAGLTFRLGDEWRASLAVTGVLCAVLLWAADLALALNPLSERRERMLTRAARAAGFDRDPRGEVEVVRQLRSQGIDAYPSVYTGNMWRFTPVLRDTLFPLGGISGVRSVMCHERGPYVMYRADEHGFTNPPGKWSAAAPADLALLGDSYVMGWCVQPAESFVAKLRERYPSTIVTGIGGSGPLMQLAMLREYLASMRPRRVLWFYYEGNDLYDLQLERGHPILRRYLEPGFTQHLASRQAEVDRELRAVAATAETTAVRDLAVRRAAAQPVHIAFSVLKLFDLRELISDWRRRRVQRACCDLPLYSKIAAEVKAEIEAWGGTLEFVYMPDEVSVAQRPLVEHAALAGDSVVAVMKSLGVPVIDLRSAMRAFGPTRDLFVQVPTAHLTPKGNDAVATVVLRDLAGRDSLRATQATAPR